MCVGDSTNEEGDESKDVIFVKLGARSGLKTIGSKY